jgi:hypothetical protein
MKHIRLYEDFGEDERALVGDFLNDSTEHDALLRLWLQSEVKDIGKGAVSFNRDNSGKSYVYVPSSLKSKIPPEMVKKLVDSWGYDTQLAERHPSEGYSYYLVKNERYRGKLTKRKFKF